MIRSSRALTHTREDTNTRSKNTHHTHTHTPDERGGALLAAEPPEAGVPREGRVGLVHAEAVVIPSGRMKNKTFNYTCGEGA